MLLHQTVDCPCSLRFPSYFSQNLSLLHICFLAHFRPSQAIVFYSQLATKSVHCCNVCNWMCVVPWPVIPKQVRKKLSKTSRTKQFSLLFPLVFGKMLVFDTFFWPHEANSSPKFRHTLKESAELTALRGHELHSSFLTCTAGFRNLSRDRHCGMLNNLVWRPYIRGTTVWL